MTPDEQCARVLGWEAGEYKPFIDSDHTRIIWHREGLERASAPAYGSDETLIGEMLAAFDRFKAENEIAEWELFTASIHDAPHGFTYWDDDGQHDFFARNKCEAVRDALIQASEVQDET